MRSAVFLPMFGLALLSCKTGEPQTSACEALCDWAVSCAEGERTVDADAMRSQCLEDTRAANGQCADAEGDGLDVAASEVLSKCTDAIDAEASAGACDAYTGSIDELKTGTPPADCAAVPDISATYDAARDSTTESGEELCQRFSETYCGRMVECLLDDVGEVPDDVSNALGGTPQELCVTAVAPQTDSCTAQDLYQAEADVTDANATRQSARECLTGVAEVACGDFLSGEVPELCAGSFSSAEDALAFAQAVAGVATDVQAVMEKTE